MLTLDTLTPPKEGQRIEIKDGKMLVPDTPIIPYIEGDGTGPDIWRATVRVLDAAVERAYAKKRRIVWFEVFAGEKSHERFKSWLPEDTLRAFSHYVVGIKGPLTTPIGGGMRSLNVALRQLLDLYACVRPVRYFENVPSPVKHPDQVDMVIFRENMEDIYVGYEFASGTADAKKLIDFVNREFKWKVRADAGVGLKPMSPYGSKRLIRKAIQYAIDHRRPSVTLVHKGNIMKYTEGAFKDWGYELAREEFGGQTISWDDVEKHHGGKTPAGKVLIQDYIADVTFQHVLTRPKSFSVIATSNLNGDYLSDAVAAQVGGIGMAPGGNLSDHHAVFEATHGTAPKYANLDKVNPGSLILSGVMMLRAPRLERGGGRHRSRARGDVPQEDRDLRPRAPHGRRARGQDERVRDRRDRRAVVAGEGEQPVPATHPKVSIVGAGNVGHSAAQWIVSHRLADVVLVDVVEGMPQGKALDLSQAGPIEGFDVSVTGSNSYDDTAGSDVVVIVAGVARKPGMTREDLLNVNAGIVTSVTKEVARRSPRSVLLVVTNPLDVMVYLAYQASGFPPERVMGQSGALDSTRFRTFIARELGVSVLDVSAMVIGAHSDTHMVPLASYASVGSIPLRELLAAGPHSGDRRAHAQGRGRDRGPPQDRKRVLRPRGGDRADGRGDPARPQAPDGALGVPDRAVWRQGSVCRRAGTARRRRRRADLRRPARPDGTRGVRRGGQEHPRERRAGQEVIR